MDNATRNLPQDIAIQHHGALFGTDLISDFMAQKSLNSSVIDQNSNTHLKEHFIPGDLQ